MPASVSKVGMLCVAHDKHRGLFTQTGSPFTVWMNVTTFLHCQESKLLACIQLMTGMTITPEVVLGPDATGLGSLEDPAYALFVPPLSNLKSVTEHNKQIFIHEYRRPGMHQPWQSLCMQQGISSGL
jgi:hypothetical protein